MNAPAFLLLLIALMALMFGCSTKKAPPSRIKPDGYAPKELPPDLWKGFDPKTASFVGREGSSLVLDGSPYRFSSVNIPNYHVVEDPAPAGGPSWHRVTAFEQRDAARAVQRLGGRAFRIYVPSVQGGLNNSPELSHISRTASGEIAYNEELWRDMDRGLAIAAEHGLRVIIPLVDNWRWFGGAAEWAALAGARDFWDDEAARGAFKSFLSWFLRRENAYSGVKYKDDPTILCWELGNEIEGASDIWLVDMAAFIKAIDPNHLIMDGSHKSLRDSTLECADIDIVTTHYVDDRMEFDASEAAEYSKAYIYGEFNPVDAYTVDWLCERAYESGAAGILAWSLRFRADVGGFYYHGDFKDSDSLQYPGFFATRPADEEAIFAALRSWAWRFRGYGEPPPELPPDPPELISVAGDGSLSFRGSAGAKWYRIERAPSLDGPWTLLADTVSDAVPNLAAKPLRGAYPLYRDSSATSWESWYRVIAVNESGESPPSAPMRAERSP